MVLLPGEDGSGLGPCCPSKGCCVLTNTGVSCSRAVGVLGFYQKFLFLIRLFSILKVSDPFMAQGGKPEQSLTLHRGGSCFCPEVQGATVSPWHSWDEKINSSQPLAHPQGRLVGRVRGSITCPGLTHTDAVQGLPAALTARLWERENCSMAAPARGAGLWPCWV